MKKTLLSAVVFTALLGVTNIVSADDGINIFNDIELHGEIRPRYEMADVDKASTQTANAFTARIHLAFSAGLFGIENLRTTLGIQSVNNFGYTNYNSTDNGHTEYDVIKDPQFAMLSEASLDYSIGKSDLHIGRSHLNIDNQRFIGTVAWRQNERSYDTLYVGSSAITNLDVLAAYVYGYQGVGADETTETASVLLHAKYRVMEALNITLYDYMLAIGKQGVDSDTYGLALTGKIESGIDLAYRVEYAIQRDPSIEFKTSNLKADAEYYNLDLGANISGILIGMNYEVLSGTDGSDGKTAFNPALGTNHKFNGWADVFYVAGVPTSGLKDANARLGYSAKGFGKLLALYHNYRAEKTTLDNSDNLGSEIDFVYANKIPYVNGLTALVKYASFFKGDVSNGFSASQNDKQVAWVQLDYKF